MKHLARRAVKAMAATVDRLDPATPGVVVLCYHQVGAPRDHEVNLPLPVFTEQVAWLAEHTTVLPLDRALDALAPQSGPSPGAPHPRDDGAARDAGHDAGHDARHDAGHDAGHDPRHEVGPHPVVVTFDDGTADFVEHALPVLAAHRVPVTLYVATDFVERGTSFWEDGTSLSWQALRDAASTGLVDIGSHTHTHALLDRVPSAVAALELDRSVALLADHLGVGVDHFAYPKALPPTAANAREVAARFRSAALAGGRPNPFGATDPFRLARTPIQVSDGMRWFRRKATGGLRLEGSLRERSARRRYAEASR